MKSRFGTIAAAMALGGCNLLTSGDGDAPAENVAEANAAVANSAGEAEERGRSALSQEQWIVGRWVNRRFNGSCDDPNTIIEYASDGRVLYAGRHVTDWRLEGDTLTQSGGSGEPNSGPVDRDGDDSFRWNDTGPFVRCTGEGAARNEDRASRGPIDGRWRVRFVASDVVYSGEFVAEGEEGVLTLDYRADREDLRVRQRCAVEAGREIAVRCRDPQMIEGSGEYAADNFFLEEVDSSTLRGAISSQPGERGTVTFTRR